MTTAAQIRQAAKRLDDQPVPDFIPETWSDLILKTFKDSLRYRREVLDPKSVWAPTNENYEEAVAWAKLCGVVIYTSDSPAHMFFLHKPGCKSVEVALCSPTDLSNAIRDYANNAKSPQCDDE